MQKYKNVAFIPVRGGSKSIPLKNIKVINNRPLIYWVLDATCSCDYIDKVYVATDSDLIKNVVKEYKNNKICIISRSNETCTDEASTESAMLEFANNYDFDNIVLVQATSPLLTSEDLSKGFLEYSKEDTDSVLSVVNQKRFMWGKDDESYYPINYNPQKRPRRQEFEGMLIENGAFYITSKENLITSKCRISGRIQCVKMKEESYFEIDDPNDWVIIEKLLKIRQDEKEKKSDIKFFISDCDGVLTDGGMYYSENGYEMKKFNTKDGMAFQLLKEHGIKIGIISGENNELIRARGKKLNVDEIYLGVKDKIKIIDLICAKYDISYENIAYIGDDINDLEVIEKVGLGCCVHDAVEVVKKSSKYITKLNGGCGAIREMAEIILNKDKN